MFIFSVFLILFALFLPSKLDLFFSIPVTTNFDYFIFEMLFLYGFKVFLEKVSFIKSSIYHQSLLKYKNKFIFFNILISSILIILKIFSFSNKQFDTCFMIPGSNSCQYTVTKQYSNLNWQPNLNKHWQLPFLNKIDYNHYYCRDNDLLCKNSIIHRNSNAHPFSLTTKITPNNISTKNIKINYAGNVRIKFMNESQILLQKDLDYTEKISNIEIALPKKTNNIDLIYKNYSCGNNIFDDSKECINTLTMKTLSINDSIFFVDTKKESYLFSNLLVSMLILNLILIICIREISFTKESFIILSNTLLAIKNKKNYNFISFILILLLFLTIAVSTYFSNYRRHYFLALYPGFLFSYLVYTAFTNHMNKEKIQYFKSFTLNFLFLIPLGSIVLFTALFFQGTNILYSAGDDHLGYASLSYDFLNTLKPISDIVTNISKPYFIYFNSLLMYIFNGTNVFLSSFYRIFILLSLLFCLSSFMFFVYDLRESIEFNQYFIIPKKKWKNINISEILIYFLYFMIAFQVIWIVGLTLSFTVYFVPGMSESLGWSFGFIGITLFLRQIFLEYLTNNFHKYIYIISYVFLMLSILNRVFMVTSVVIIPFLFYMFFPFLTALKRVIHFSYFVVLSACLIIVCNIVAENFQISQFLFYLTYNSSIGHDKDFVSIILDRFASLFIDKGSIVIFINFIMIPFISLYFKVKNIYKYFLSFIAIFFIFKIVQSFFTVTGYYPRTLIFSLHTEIFFAIIFNITLIFSFVKFPKNSV